jgi:hypothetical protein
LIDNDSPVPASVDASERALAKKFGIRELVYPDTEQTRVLQRYLDQSIEARHSGPVPKTAVLILAEFFQAVLNRQFLTKAPSMPMEEYEALQAPYHLAAGIVTQVLYERRELAKTRGRIYQTTQLRLHDFIDLLRGILDPACSWIRLGTIPDNIVEQMEMLRDFVARYPEARRREREEKELRKRKL